MFKTIREDYAKFFRECPKINSNRNKKSVIIRESLYSEFVKSVLADPRLELEVKLLVAILASTGVRITEALHLKKEQIDLNSKKVRNILVQKKRRNDVRIDKPLHPEAMEFFAKVLPTLESDWLFEGFNRFQALRRMKRYFNMGNHDYRHSFVNYFLYSNANQGLERITKIMAWSSFSSAYAYSQNADLDQEIENFFKVG